MVWAGSGWGTGGLDYLDNYVVRYALYMATSKKSAKKSSNKSAKKSGGKPMRKLTKVGGVSYAVALPIAAIKQFGWKEHQKLTVQVDLKNKKLIIRDWKR